LFNESSALRPLTSPPWPPENTRSRFTRFWWALGFLVVVAPLHAQVTAASGRSDSASVTRPTPAPAQILPDSLRPPVSPGRAFLTSLLVPGLGQSRLGRQVPGAIYAGVEIMSVVMLLKAQNDLRIARRSAVTTVVTGYRIDQETGMPVLDENGRFVPADTAPNRFDTDRIDARRTQVEDWIAVLAFNHLFSGADAFVASLLWDLPARVGARHLPRGFGLGLSVRW
jgi:hypothetical protein